MAHCLRPWKDEYQLLCSIDSVSGEMKSISPFQVPKQYDLDDQTAASIQSHFKIIETISDFQESKAFRARLSGAVSSLWNVEANCSALDTAKVNSKDIFGYYSLHFTKSRVVVSGAALNTLPLTREAERAIRHGMFREQYGDMIVVGYITGGEAEAVLRVTSFKEDRRDSIRKALRVALQDNAGGSGQIHAVVNDAISVAVSGAAAPLVPAGGAAEVARGLDDVQALQDATMTMVSRRTGVTHQDQLHNPNNFPQLLKQLTKAAENTGVKISALCYRVELFNQVPNDVLGFARTVVDENVNVLQKQFAQVQFVYNSCEAHLTPSAVAATPEDIVREMRKLQRDACAAMQRFANFKGYRDVGNLATNDSTRTVGSQLVQRFDDLREKIRVAEVKAKVHQHMDKRESDGRAWPNELYRKVASDTDMLKSEAWGAGTSQSEAPMFQPDIYCDGVLHGFLLAGRNFPTGRVRATQLYIVIKLDGRVHTSPSVSVNKNSATFLWSFSFQLDITAKQLSEDTSLTLEVYDKSTLLSDKFLGVVTIKLRQACGAAAKLGMSSFTQIHADGDRTKPNWYPVEKVDGGGKYKPRGELQLKLHFSRHHGSAFDLQQLADELSSRSFPGCGVPAGKAAEASPSQRPPKSGGPATTSASPSASTSTSSPVTGYPLIPPFSNAGPGPFVAGAVPVVGWQPGVPTPWAVMGVLGQPQLCSGAEHIASTSSACDGKVRGLHQVWSFALRGDAFGDLDECCSSDGDDSDDAHQAEAEAGPRRMPYTASQPDLEGCDGSSSWAEAAATATSTTAVLQRAKGQKRFKSAVDMVVDCASFTAALSQQAAAQAREHDGPVRQRRRVHTPEDDASSQEDVVPPLPSAEAARMPDEPHRRSGVHQPKQERKKLKEEQKPEQHQPKKKARRGGFLGFLVRLTVTGVVFGSAGAAAVVVGRRRFGVDLVAESKRLAVEYGTVARRTSITWGKQGSTAVRSWTARLVEKVRRRHRLEGNSTIGDGSLMTSVLQDQAAAGEQ